MKSPVPVNILFGKLSLFCWAVISPCTGQERTRKREHPLPLNFIARVCAGERVQENCDLCLVRTRQICANDGIFESFLQGKDEDTDTPQAISRPFGLIEMNCKDSGTLA